MLFNGNRFQKQYWWRQFGHGERYVPTLVDWTYPLFLFCAGIALSFSFEKALERGGTPRMFMRRLTFRGIRLFLLGVLLVSLPQLRSVPLLGTLQCLAIAILGAASIYCFFGYRAALTSVLVLFLLGYLTSAFPLPPGVNWLERWNSDMTAIERVDLALIGRTGGMEGIITTLLAMGFVLSGVIVRPHLDSPHLVWAGLLMVVLAFCAATLPAPESSLWIPFVSQVFSLSFTALCIGLSLLSLALFDRLLRTPLAPAVRWIFLPFGRNAILAYAGVNAFRKIFFESCLLSCPSPHATFKSFALDQLSQLAGPAGATFLLAAFLLGGAWLICAILLKRGIIITI